MKRCLVLAIIFCSIMSCKSTQDAIDVAFYDATPFSAEEYYEKLIYSSEEGLYASRAVDVLSLEEPIVIKPAEIIEEPDGEITEIPATTLEIKIALQDLFTDKQERYFTLYDVEKKGYSVVETHVWESTWSIKGDKIVLSGLGTAVGKKFQEFLSKLEEAEKAGKSRRTVQEEIHDVYRKLAPREIEGNKIVLTLDDDSSYLGGDSPRLNGKVLNFVVAPVAYSVGSLTDLTSWERNPIEKPDLSSKASGFELSVDDIATCRERFKDRSLIQLCMDMRVSSQTTHACVLMEEPMKIRKCLIKNARPKSDKKNEISAEIVDVCKKSYYEKVCLEKNIPVTYTQGCSEFFEGDSDLTRGCMEAY